MLITWREIHHSAITINSDPQPSTDCFGVQSFDIDVITTVTANINLPGLGWSFTGSVSCNQFPIDYRQDLCTAETSITLVCIASACSRKEDSHQDYG